MKHTIRAPQSDHLLLIIAYLGFISLGLPDTLIGVAWPSVRDHFARQQSEIAFIFFGAAGSYFLSSFFTGRLLRLLRIGTLLAASSGAVALSGFGYAVAPVWALFAACSLLHGLGSGAIDAGLNHFVAHHFSARHMNWLHACYSVGATIGPLVMTAMIAWIGSWSMGYLSVALTLGLLTILFTFTRRRWDGSARGNADASTSSPSAGLAETLRHPTVWLQIALFFVYTGTEVTIGQWSFTVLTESRHVPKATAGLWVTLYWASIVAGRILFGFVAERLGLDRLLRWATFASLLGACVFALNLPGPLNPIALVVVGLGLAPVYPCLMTRTPQRLGSALAVHAIGFQVSAATAGAAALPSLSGLLAQSFTPETVTLAGVGMTLVVCLLHEILVRTG